MYLDYYNLKKQPFSISPDPAFIWFSQKHAEAFSTLKYGILEDKGFLVLTGDVGTGKTLLIKNLEKNISIPAIIVTVPDPDMKTLEFFNYLADEIQINKPLKTKGDFLIRFKNFLNEAYGTHKKVLLILDEAQRLNYKLLEEIRLLSNFERTDQKLLNIFFVGQNEFADMLKDDRCKAVRQRIIVRYRLYPFNEEETLSYITHRLKVAGTEKQIFSLNAVKEIFTFSAGFPRLINILCDNALLYGWSTGLPLINADVIIERAKELEIEKPKLEEKDIQIIEKETTETTKTIIQEPQKEEIRDYEFQIEEEILDQSIEGIEKENDESLFVNDKKLNKYEIEETKALILHDIPQDKPSHKPFEALKYIWIAGFVLIAGLSIFYFYNSNIKSDLPWSIDEVAPKQKFVISENKKPSVDKEQIIISKPSKNLSTEQSNSTQFEEEKSTRKSELIDKRAADLNEKIVEKKSSEEVLISESYSKESIVKPASKAPSLVKTNITDDVRSSLPNRKILEKSRIIINFTHNSFELNENALEILNLIIKFALEHSNTEMIVEGFTDSFGNFWYNQKLSQLRADTVKKYFVEQGISPSRIKTIGRGQDGAVGNNETVQGRMLNRRVEIKFSLTN